MIGFNSWVSGIVASSLIASLIEMILPESKNKKYVKMVIGIFILFTILSPVISYLTHKDIEIEKLLSFEGTNNNNTYKIEYSKNIDKQIIQTYENNIENSIKSYINTLGFNTKKIDAKVYENEENYGNIKSLNIFLTNNTENENDITLNINNVDIKINEIEKIKSDKLKKDDFENLEEDDNKNYSDLINKISDEFKIDKSIINIYGGNDE